MMIMVMNRHRTKYDNHDLIYDFHPGVYVVLGLPDYYFYVGHYVLQKNIMTTAMTGTKTGIETGIKVGDKCRTDLLTAYRAISTVRPG